MNAAEGSWPGVGTAVEPPASVAQVWKGSPVWLRRTSLLLLAALIGILYTQVFRALLIDWWEDENSGHGLLVPFFAGWVLWRERSRYAGIIVRPAYSGLAVMVAAIGSLIVGTLGAGAFTARISFVLLLAGLVLFLAGRAALRAVAFPLGCLLLMIPVPAVILDRVALPLQLVASQLATAGLELMGFAVLREGNIIYIGNSAIEVAEACSGVRSLVSIIALAVAFGYVARSSRWIRIVLAAAMVPVTVAANTVRVTGAGLVAYYLGGERVNGFLHTFSGLLVFATAVGLMLAIHKLLQGASFVFLSRQRR